MAAPLKSGGQFQMFEVHVDSNCETFAGALKSIPPDGTADIETGPGSSGVIHLSPVSPVDLSVVGVEILCGEVIVIRGTLQHAGYAVDDWVTHTAMGAFKSAGNDEVRVHKLGD
jgi:hypothetical protein